MNTQIVLFLCDAVLNEKKKRSQVSCREYYLYKLQIKSPGKFVLLHTGRLFQQYVVDMYVKIETTRLDYFRNNQKKFRAELYQGIVDSVESGETMGYKIGRKFVLPQSFKCGPRDLLRRYMDTMAIVQRYGKLDVFFIVTCNPNWPEIKKELRHNDDVQNRSDLIVRILRAKLEELKNDLYMKNILCPVIAHIFMIEFQKRGLPHAHLLLIFNCGHKICCTEHVDKIFSCEIPDKEKHSYLHSVIVKHNMHGPCGNVNPKNVCMEPNKGCKNKYPKDYCNSTIFGDDSYPLYRRRNNGISVKVRGQILDNRWVVPYNPYLSAKFDCHINIEVCSSIKAVKYLYKYVYRCHDRINFCIDTNETNKEIDEISAYQSVRWIYPPEAMWRILSFNLSDIYPSVYSLQLHIEDHQQVTYANEDDLFTIIQKENTRKTMLTEFFRMNETNEFARTLLRPVSFNDLRTLNGVTIPTYREAALLHGLLSGDNHCEECISEDILYEMPTALRRLFATLLTLCNTNHPKLLWDKFKVYMIDDYVYQNISVEVAELRALEDISSILKSLGKNVNNYAMVSFNVNIDEIEKLRRMVEDETIHFDTQGGFDCATTLNKEQQFAYDTIMKKVKLESNGAFFIDDPGGTGKTFLYKALLSGVSSQNLIALTTASSRVCASLLPRGRIGHSRFKIHLETIGKISCSVGKQSALGNLLNMSRLIIWDEEPIVNRSTVEAVDKMFRDITDCNLLFGGKVVVLGGDFRQVLPVVRKGKKYDIMKASLVFSDLWPSFLHLPLTENMRAKLDPTFCSYLLRIGDGIEKKHTCKCIELREDIVLPFEDEISSLKNLIHHFFPDIETYADNLQAMANRVILTPTNECVDHINRNLFEQIPGESYAYYSFDEAIDKLEQNLQEDFLHSLNLKWHSTP
ncbi:uncharacterized protein LOC111400679 [Olea europaea var. sylvestris]|uniref:uncharacterized protein LOC111400679 n=1 Tax=Olea europaea var. sylvestris TaxID=158386 RepID=UPI000C1D7D16|nr:uncharacterized protein LOC111400679 [Olea europaea var. sylvestris]